MLSQDMRALIRNQYNEYKSYRKVAALCKVAPNTVKNIVLGLHKEAKKSPGPKPLLGRHDKLALRRQIESLAADGRKVTAKKVMNECKITRVSIRTMRRPQYN